MAKSVSHPKLTRDSNISPMAKCQRFNLDYFHEYVKESPNNSLPVLLVLVVGSQVLEVVMSLSTAKV